MRNVGGSPINAIKVQSGPSPSLDHSVKGKVVIVGEYSVGKTSLLHRFVHRIDAGRVEPTIGAAFQVKVLPIYPVPVKESTPSGDGNTPVSAKKGGSSGDTRSIVKAVLHRTQEALELLSGPSGCVAPVFNDRNKDTSVAAHDGRGGYFGPLVAQSSNYLQSSALALFQHAPLSSGSPFAHYQTGVNNTSENYLSGPQNVKLELWDTAGSERYRSLMPMYFRDATAAVLCFEISSISSFDKVNSWLMEFRKYNTTTSRVRDSDRELERTRNSGGWLGGALCVLCATKCDLPPEQHEVSSDEARQFADENGLVYYETSAKLDCNVGDLFTHIAQYIYYYNVWANVLHNGDAALDDGVGGNKVGIGGGKTWGKGKVNVKRPNNVENKRCSC
eukprot:Tbor_TRINITY_DN8321_c0_g1::TRINITY_DN8321_c0_g1_i1::g.21080::m.21080